MYLLHLQIVGKSGKKVWEDFKSPENLLKRRQG